MSDNPQPRKTWGKVYKPENPVSLQDIMQEEKDKKLAIELSGTY